MLAGGLIGSAARLGLSASVATPVAGFPMASLIVNLTGSLLLGFYLARRQRSLSGPFSVQFWGIGVFGSLTTFSAFSVEVVQLVGHGEAALAAGYVAASVVGGLIVVLVGQRIGSVLR
ncbi:MAG TPA: CrcB family protein [Acidimicrobiia bacterium]|nr:CrcB family protein [Acidimicrobiia bacterium]